MVSLNEILGRPEINGDVSRDWADVERGLGFGLPLDYKEFVTAYGPGCVSGVLDIFHPRANVGGLRLDTLWEHAYNSYRSLSSSYPEMYPYPVYPEPDGLIAVARTFSGNVVYLAPRKLLPSVRNDWAVVIEMGEFVVLDLSFTEFLCGALTGEVEIPMFEEDPYFEAVGTVNT